MRIKFAAFIFTVLVSTSANAAEDYNDYAFESYSPSSNKIAPARDFDNLYSIPLSKTETLKLGGNINFKPELHEPQEMQARLSLNYSMNF